MLLLLLLLVRTVLLRRPTTPRWFVSYQTLPTVHYGKHDHRSAAYTKGHFYSGEAVNAHNLSGMRRSSAFGIVNPNKMLYGRRMIWRSDMKLS